MDYDGEEVTEFQSAPPVKGATLSMPLPTRPITVSIRAPREGGDFWDRLQTQLARVSIRAPREGGDPTLKSNGRKQKFQSAPPVKGATSMADLLVRRTRFQSAPPVKGATDLLAADFIYNVVSIRAPREGGDLGQLRLTPPACRFNPRPP